MMAPSVGSAFLSWGGLQAQGALDEIPRLKHTSLRAWGRGREASSGGHMEDFDLEGYLTRSRAVDLSGIDWAAIPRQPLSSEALRCLRYMQAVERHTLVYTRTLLSTRAI